MPVIRGSSVGLYDNGVFLCDTNNSCPRFAVGRMLGIEQQRMDFNPVFRLGHIFEENFCGTNGEREVEVVHEFDNITFMGHADFVTLNRVYELKSVSSINVERDLRLRHKYKFANLVQLVTYMMFLDKTEGRLVYGDYTGVVTYDKLKFYTEEEVNALANYDPVYYEFDVEIRNDTEVFVEGIKTLDTTSIIRYIHNIARVFHSGELPPHPAQADDKGADVCFFCPYKDLCWDDSSSINSRDEFYNYIRRL